MTSTEEVSSISAQSLKSVMGSGALLVDVRSIVAYNQAHIVNAQSISMPTILWRRFLKYASQPGSLDAFLMGDSTAQIGARKTAPVVVVYDENSSDSAAIPMDHPLLVLCRYFMLEGCNTRYLYGGFQAALAKGVAVESVPDDPVSGACLPSVSTPPLSQQQADDSSLNFISGFLAIGSEKAAHDLDLLRREGVTHVLNLTAADCHPEVQRTMTWHKIELRDSFTEDLLAHLKGALEFIDRARASNGKVLVHCFAGISRSVAVAIGYVMWSEQRTLSEAMALVQCHRPCASPNLNFVGQLLALGSALQLQSPCTALPGSLRRSISLNTACKNAAARLSQRMAEVRA
jgi:protein-tyrosine phosphatase